MTTWKTASTPLRATMVAALLCVTACQVQVLTPPTPKPVETKPKATATPGVKPSTPPVVSESPSPTPSPTPAALNLLQQPEGAGTVIAGQVKIDAHYLLGTGQGKLIGQAGGNLIGQAGGNVIAVGGGNLIGQAGGNLIGQAGGNLIGQAGGNLIATDAANLIGQAGGNLIGKRKYDLLQANNTLALGTMLPAAEMLIQVLSMVNGKPLALGTNKAGQPVFGIYTNATGDYKIFLPATLAGKNVLVVALPPSVLEDRLNYQVMVDVAGNAQAVVDEDTALVSEYLREAFASRLERLFLDTDPNALDLDIPAAFKPIIQVKLDRLLAASKTGAPLTTAERRRRALRAADSLLAYTDLETIKLDGSSELVMPKLRKMMLEMREATGERMKTPGYFDTQEFLVEVNAEQAAAGLPPYEIKKPADLGDYVRRRILMSHDRNRTAELVPIFASVGMPATYRDELNASMNAIMMQIGLKIGLDEVAFAAAEAAARGE